jgi:heterodisulfide reductase subunit C
MTRMNGSVDQKQVEFVSLMLRRAVSETTEVCQQCGKCPSGCPVSKHIEGFNPRHIIAKVSLGRIDELLGSEALWTCTSCLKCKERCPENISPYDVILTLRTLAYRSGYEYPSGYDDFINAVIEKGVTKDPQEVRTRNQERRNRSSLGLPKAECPRDLKTFSDILRNMTKGGSQV